MKNNLVRLQPHQVHNGDKVLVKYKDKLMCGIIDVFIGSTVSYHFHSVEGFNLDFTLANVELEVIKFYKVGK